MRKKLRTVLLAILCGCMGIAAEAGEWKAARPQTVCCLQRSDKLREPVRRISTTRRRGRRHGRRSGGGRNSLSGVINGMKRNWHNAWQMNWERLQKKMYP